MSKPNELPEGYARVSLFKPSGKWYADGAIDMRQHYDENGDTHAAVYRACSQAHERQQQVTPDTPATGHYFGELFDGWPVLSSPYAWLVEGGMVVCLDPHHKHAHPIMLTGSYAQRNPY